MIVAPTGDRWQRVSDAVVRRLDRAWERLETASEDEPTSRARTLQQVIDRLDLRVDEQRYLTNEVANDTGAMPDEVGARDYGLEGEDEADGFVGPGLATIVNALAQGLDVRTGHVVSSIEHGSDGVMIGLNSGESLQADYALVTIPLSLLKRDTIVFDPTLSARKRRAMDTIGFGTYDKLAMRFERRFWGDDWTILTLLDDYFAGPSSIINSARGRSDAEVAGGAALVGTITAAWGRLVTPRPVDLDAQRALVELYVRRLRGVFGDSTIAESLPPGASLPAFKLQSWTHDPFAAGCYSVATPGSLEARTILGEPESGTLFFAGEAVGGYVDGEVRTATITAALLSGATAADQIASVARAELPYIKARRRLAFPRLVHAALDRSEHAFGRDRQLGHAVAGGTGDRVGDGGRDGDDRRLSHAAEAEGGAGLGGVLD